MYIFGHIGISLMVCSIVVAIFGLDKLNVDIIITIGFIVGLSGLPDIDHRFEMLHRGFTHSFLFAFILGLIGYFIFGLIGFIVLFGAIILHIVGDIFNYQEVRIFWPKDRGISLKLFRSDNQIANYGFLVIGVLFLIIF